MDQLIIKQYCTVVLIPFFLALLVLMIFSQTGYAREELKIVGSTTVFPYANAVATHYADRYSKPIPTIGVGGSGDGIKAFCAGVGEAFPDIANASRPMKQKEWQLCLKNGVSDISEVTFGRDGIALVTSHKNKTLHNLTVVQLFLAMAQYIPINGVMVANPNRLWSDVDPSLPKTTIQIYAPDQSHGTYGILLKKIIKKTCKNTLAYFKDLKKSGISGKDYQKAMRKYCSRPRSDGGFISLSVDNRRMALMLKENKISLFFTSYSNLFKNRNRLKAISINGVEPRIYTISDNSYVLSRPLFFYVKNAHRRIVPNMKLYLKEFLSGYAMHTFGYLMRLGLGNLPLEELKKAQYSVVIGSQMTRFGKSNKARFYGVK